MPVASTTLFHSALSYDKCKATRAHFSLFIERSTSMVDLAFALISLGQVLLVAALILFLIR